MKRHISKNSSLNDLVLKTAFSGTSRQNCVGTFFFKFLTSLLQALQSRGYTTNALVTGRENHKQVFRPDCLSMSACRRRHEKTGSSLQAFGQTYEGVEAFSLQNPQSLRIEA